MLGILSLERQKLTKPLEICVYPEKVIGAGKLRLKKLKKCRQRFGMYVFLPLITCDSSAPPISPSPAPTKNRILKLQREQMASKTMVLSAQDCEL